MSPGGPAELSHIDLSGREGLDFGCSVGGYDRLIVAEHGAAAVYGINLGAVVIAKAMAGARADGLGDRLHSSVLVTMYTKATILDSGAEFLATRGASVFDVTMLIGVISDTGLADVDHIIHAGDIGNPEIVPRLREIAPVTAIRGNVDTQAWASAFHERETVELADRSIYVLHDLGELDFDPAERGLSMVISGHSHRPRIETIDGVLYLNPGSAGPRRFRLLITLATVEVYARAIRPLIHALAR